MGPSVNTLPFPIFRCILGAFRFEWRLCILPERRNEIIKCFFTLVGFEPPTIKHSCSPALRLRKRNIYDYYFIQLFFFINDQVISVKPEKAPLDGAPVRRAKFIPVEFNYKELYESWLNARLST